MRTLAIAFFVGFVSFVGGVALGQTKLPAQTPLPVVSGATVTPTPDPRPSEQELAAATQRAQFLTNRYQVPTDQVAALTKVTYDIGALVGLAADQRTALDQQVLFFAENGGSGLRPFGIEGDDLAVAKALGGSSELQLLALTKPQIVQARTLMATIGLNKSATALLEKNQSALAQNKQALEAELALATPVSH